MSWWIAGAATVGAVADRKKPLRGAAMGAGLMATGGAAAGAMGGGAGAAGGLLGGSTAAAGSAAPAAAGTAAPSTGLLASANSALTQYKPMIDAASTGIQMSGALDQQPQQQAQAPAPMMNQGGAEVLGQLAGQGGSMQGDIQERARRRTLLRGGV
jgi:hypothetical protein